MRVAHLLRKYNPAEWGGTETAIQRLFEGLRKQDVESIVYCPRIESNGGVSDPLRSAGCRIERFTAFVPVWGISAREKQQMISVGGNLMSFNLIPSLWRERGLSIIHTHALGRIGAIGLTIARRRKLPLVASIHGGVLDLPQKIKAGYEVTARRGWEWGRIFGWLLRSRGLLDEADAIVTCNPKEAALWQKQFPHKRVLVQPHGVPVENYQADHRKAACDAFPEIRERRMLLCVGRIDSTKNQAWLVERAPALFKNHPETILVMAGACTEEKYGKLMENRIHGLGLGGRVLLTGGLPPGDPRLIGLLQQAEALVLPSISETFGLVLLEAWAAGTAVISSRTSGATTLIKEGENGWLFDLERPETFHAAVDEALRNEGFRKQSAARGGKLAMSEYNTDVLAARMKQLYEQLIEEKHAPRDSAR
ncbi:MAG TPA: glycosyltransferase family 4 protein [Verrucomicrobiae bacterium]|nr:glycosyltransferase family 4 protein [Verrucomicrobiae bacterium]